MHNENGLPHVGLHHCGPNDNEAQWEPSEVPEEAQS